MSTDHPGRPFRYGIRFKIAVSIGVIMVALMAVDILWNLSLQNAQAENEAREKAEVLASEMRAAWDFVDMNQDVINRAEDGTFRTKHLVCVVAAKSISMLFTTETDYSIRFTNDTPRQAANAPDEFEQEALAAFNADPERKAFWRVVDAGDGTRVFRYTEPLYVTESCLECHGDPVGELDQYGYPKEGMQVGQVGGAMSITEPMDIYAAGIQDSMMQQAIMVLFMMVAAFIGLYFVTSRLVLRPIDELRSAAGAVGSNAGWMSFRNPADYISYGYPWANLSTENLYFEGKTVNKNGYSVQKFLDAGLKLSVYNADLDVDMDYYLTYKDKLYAICTNYPRKLLGKWN